MGSIFIAVLCICVFHATHGTPKDRVIKENILSKDDHWKKAADGADEHNSNYDHEAFLGEDGMKDFDGLSPEKGKEALSVIFDKIDKNGDKQVDSEELTAWLKRTQNKYILEDADKQMKQNDANKDGEIDWEEYKKSTYGFIDDNNDELAGQYKDMIARDERRFVKADKNSDGRLTMEEFGSFLHPESDNDMKSIVVDETLEDIDKDKDGFISLNEYVGDLWPEEDRESGEEPDWVRTEKSHFADYRDKNKDGKMDRSEVAEWILPPDYDHIGSEVQHLISESDENKDSKISKDEMLGKYDLFVGSQATDFGEALKKPHEEL